LYYTKKQIFFRGLFFILSSQGCGTKWEPFWLGMGQTITAVASFLLTLAFANLVPKETFGTYRFVLSLAGILAIPTLSGMNTALLQAVARGKDGSFMPILKTKLRWGILGSLGSIALGGYYFFKGNTTLTLCFLITAAFLPIFNSFQIHESFWAGRKKFDTQNKYRIITHITATAVLIATIILTKNIFLILLAYFLSWTALYLVFLLLTIKKAHLNKEQDAKTMPYGKHLSLMGIIGTIDVHIDKLVLWHFLGAAPVAIFVIAASIPKKIKHILNTISGLAFPKFSARSKEELKASMPKRMLQIFLITTPIAVLYILFAKPIFKLLFPQYLEAVKYSQVYALVLLTYPRTLLGTALRAKMQTKALYRITCILPPTYIVLLFILVPYFGIWGLVATWLILEVITFGVQLFMFRRM